MMKYIKIYKKTFYKNIFVSSSLWAVQEVRCYRLGAEIKPQRNKQTKAGYRGTILHNEMYSQKQSIPINDVHTF